LYNSPVDVLVCSAAPPASWQGRMVQCIAGRPRKIAHILTDIATEIVAAKQQQLMLSEHVMLSEKNRVLERMDNGASCELTEKEMMLLLFLYRTQEATREEILRQVWGVGGDVDTHTLETHVYRLRQKWKEIAEEDCILATDKGYRWHG
jgi:DNA-binding response OmpR family regulator